MKKHLWVQRASGPFAIVALLMLWGPGTAKADPITDCSITQCFTITFQNWGLPDGSSRTINGFAYADPQSLEGFLNPAYCLGGTGPETNGCSSTPPVTVPITGPIPDPVVILDGGDPPTSGGTVDFTVGEAFSFILDSSASTADGESFVLINQDPSTPAFAFDFTTLFDANDPNSGDLFSCSGNITAGCGFKTDDLVNRFNVVPEPGSVWLLMTAAGAVVYWRKRISRG